MCVKGKVSAFITIHNLETSSQGRIVPFFPICLFLHLQVKKEISQAIETQVRYCLIKLSGIQGTQPRSNLGTQVVYGMGKEGIDK